MKIIFPLILILFITGCSKEIKKEGPTICLSNGLPAWLSEKQTEYQNCTCQVVFIQGTYQSIPVYELRITDPLCNSINYVYRSDGILLLTSSQQAQYAKYLAEITDATIIWSCNKEKK